MVKNINTFFPDGEERFKQIFENWYPKLLRFAKEYVDDWHEAEDILQNVFLKLWEKQTFLSTGTNLNAYLFTMVKNRCMDFLNHQKVVERFANHQKMKQHEAIFNHNAISKFASEPMDIETLERLVEKAIAELPGQCRKVFELSRYEGLKYREIAERLGISVKTVETHISNALNLLRKKLIDESLV